MAQNLRGLTQIVKKLKNKTSEIEKHLRDDNRPRRNDNGL